MQKLLKFCHDYFFVGIVLFLIAFIPLFPKIPLLDVVGTWVDIRREDIIIAFAIFVLGIQILRKKATINTPLTIPIIGYWLAGLLSLIVSLVFIAPHLSNFFPNVAILFYLRQIEYMIIFFLGFEALRHNKKMLPWIVAVIAITALCVFIYGLGQKYQGWPAYSTMNEEFSKGIPLQLPRSARVMSTFAGHYDLAAYLVFTIPILGSLFFGVKNKLARLGFLGITICCFILLLLTASRVSFGVYLVTISCMLWWQKKRWAIIPVIILSVIMVNFVSGASERFLKTFRFNDVVVDLSTGKPIGTLEKLEGGKATLERIKNPDEENLPEGSSFINVPVNTPATQSGSIGSVEIIKKKNLAAGTQEVATVSGSFLVQKAFVLDISITTRFQGQWPRAIDAFKRNILTGSGFSILSLAADGNYHRLLAETGIVGTISFLGIFLYAFYYFWKTKNALSPLEKAFVIGIFSGIVGLLLNAVLIDVFQASKVAFTLWLLLGVAMAILAKERVSMSYPLVLYRFFYNKYSLLTYICLGIFILYLPSINLYFIGDDFTWLRWAAESRFSDVPAFFTNASGFFYRPIPKLWYFILFSIFWLVPQAYHLASIALFTGMTLFLLGSIYELTRSRFIAGCIGILFALLSIHHENVYWISGQSSLLAGFFLLGSIYLAIKAWKNTIVSKKYALGSAIFLVLAMLSWDTLFVAPIILALLGFVGFKRKQTLCLLILIPLYLFLRNYSHAVPPAGDYGINTSRLLVNSIGNSVTYVAGTFLGPKAIEVGQYVRGILKTYSFLLTGGSALVLIGIGFWLYSKKVFKKDPFLVVFVVSAIVSLIPFIGLGGATDRYALVPSSLILIVLGLLLKKLAASSFSLPIKILPFLTLFTFCIWNYGELGKLSKEWQFAGNVTQQTLKIIRTQFFPPTSTKTFIFVDTPIRYGHAWIFPTGLNEALWHIYRQTPFVFVQVGSIDTALAYPHPKDTDKIVLIFENYKLQQVVKEVEN